MRENFKELNYFLTFCQHIVTNYKVTLYDTINALCEILFSVYRFLHPSAPTWTPRLPLGCSLKVSSTVFCLLLLTSDGR